VSSSNTKRNPESQIEKNELYNTPTIAMESLHSQYPSVLERFNVFYENSDGMGQISDYLESIGKKVYRADIVDYRGKLNFKEDFLQREALPADVECIIMNPPFTLTEEFMDKSLSLCPNVIMFNRTSTIASIGRGKKFNSGEWPCTNMYQFSFRVSCPKGVEMEPTANSVDYAFYVFNRYAQGDTVLKWIVK
jgi:hypothetical protein